ncbi:MAG: dihydrodipicolinate synthase family protein, partial [bacterium]|nr:dihydrodipicolinate synthase family protein [bacterium]
MDTAFIRGIIPAVITPMTVQEELHEEGMRDLLEALIRAGVHGVFTVGTAGESWALSVEEKKRLFEWTVRFTDRRVPVYVGTAANTTREAVQLAEYAQEAGVDCLS